MGTHCFIFLTIGNLASPPGFAFAGKVKGRMARPSHRLVRSAHPGADSRGLRSFFLDIGHQSFGG